MIGRSLGQTIEVLGQEWRFKGQAGGSSSTVQHQPVPCHKKGLGESRVGFLAVNWQFGVMALQETMALVHHILQFLIAAFCLIYPGYPGATLRNGCCWCSSWCSSGGGWPVLAIGGLERPGWSETSGFQCSWPTSRRWQRQLLLCFVAF